MSMGFQVAVCAVPFFDLLDEEEQSLAAQVADAADDATAAVAMQTSRQRLAQGVDRVVRSLPAAVRGDLTASRAVAYALVGLADGRMLHHPAGGLERWRERLLEFELYGSALAGQEVVAQARAALANAQGTPAEPGHLSSLAPFYLGVFRAGFEGSLRGDAVGLSSLIAALEDVVGAHRPRALAVPRDVRPTRAGLTPLPLVALGLTAWLVAGFAVWLALGGQSLEESDRMAERLGDGLPAATVVDPLDYTVGPSGLTSTEREDG